MLSKSNPLFLGLLTFLVNDFCSNDLSKDPIKMGKKIVTTMAPH